MHRASCLCGDVTCEADGEGAWMSHCHCSRCRKAHGAAFGTYVAGPGRSFRLRGAERIVRYESSPGFVRPFCGRCGSVVPGDPWQGQIFFPAGNLEDDPGIRPVGHIFVASKAPWFEIRDDLPRSDGYPEGFDSPSVPDRPPLDPPGRPRGSCLCGAVTYVVEGEPRLAVHCHCGRCRKARSAAFATNLICAVDGVRFTRGEDHRASFKPPGARFFTTFFCRACGSPMPRIDRERGLAIVPMASLDDDPGIRPQAHIFVGSKAPWDVIADDLPQHAEGPPPG
jgi:hypothetical protein